MRKVTLPQNVRVFRIAYGMTLGRTDYVLHAGDEIEIEPVQEMTYDHHEQTTVPFTYMGERYYMLLKETGLGNLVS